MKKSLVLLAAVLLVPSLVEAQSQTETMTQTAVEEKPVEATTP